MQAWMLFAGRAGNTSRQSPLITRSTGGHLPQGAPGVQEQRPSALLTLAGTYGDPQAGDPIQYDELRIEHDQGDVEIVVYNRAILLFFTDSEAVKRIHQVCAAGS